MEFDYNGEKIVLDYNVELHDRLTRVAESLLALGAYDSQRTKDLMKSNKAYIDFTKDTYVRMRDVLKEPVVDKTAVMSIVVNGIHDLISINEREKYALMYMYLQILTVLLASLNKYIPEELTARICEDIELTINTIKMVRVFGCCC